MARRYLLGFDVGSSSVKASLTDVDNGEIVASAFYPDHENDYYKVQVGAFRQLSNAIKMEQKLRKFRYNTYIVYS